MRGAIQTMSSSLALLLLCLSHCCRVSSAGAATSSATTAAGMMRRNVVAGAAIFTAGDAAAQLWTSPSSSSDDGDEGRRMVIDTNRLSNSACIGALWSGLCVPAVYSYVETLLPGRSPGRVVAKMVITCSILSTAGNYATMFARRLTEVLRQEDGIGGSLTVGECLQSCNDDILDVIKDDLKIWPLYDLLCYSIIPPSMRAISTAAMSSGWAMYMSIVSARVSSTCASGADRCASS